MQARAICSRLLRLLRGGALEGTVLSAFDHAVNVDTPVGLVSLLTGARCLQPYSVVIGGVPAFAGIAPGDRAHLTERTVAVGGAGIALDGAAETDLSVAHAFARGPAATVTTTGHRPIPDPAPLLLALAPGGDGCGLSTLVTGGEPNVYAVFLAPRLPRLFDAVEAGDAAQAGEAAARIAGCGVGLTPSSDDLLTGYMAMLHALSAVGVLGDVAPVTQAIAASAAQCTNRISGAFLLQSGAGYVSADVLDLLQLLCSGADERLVYGAASRVASFGSTSGSDILTGIVLAIIHHDGGKNSGQTGNQKECLL